MLPKHHRLTRSKDFSRVRRRGRSAGNALLVIYVLPVRSPDIRVGFSVSKKVGKAVVRNRVRRRMREAIRAQVPAMRPGQDVVVIARPAAAAATYCQLVDAILAVLQKTGSVRAAPEATHA
jgi:ribonuclease P protein component